MMTGRVRGLPNNGLHYASEGLKQSEEQKAKIKKLKAKSKENKAMDCYGSEAGR